MRCLRTSRKALCSLAAALLTALALPGAALAAKAGGYISLEEFYSRDSASASSRHFMTGRVRLDLTKLNKPGTLGFHFDGRQRVDIGSSYGSSDKEGRIDLLNLDYTGKRLYLAAGRLWPKDMPIEVIDGLNAVYRGDKTSFGVFGGMRPNPYSQSATADFTSAGLYANHSGQKLSAGLAFVHNGYQGATDRQYIYSQALWSPWAWLMAFGTATVDINPLTGEMKLTNGVGEVTLRPDDAKSLTVGYNQFRAYRYYASSLYGDIDDGRQDAWYVGANYRFLARYMAYARVEWQKRYFPSVEEAFRGMMSYRVGLTADDLAGTGVSMNAGASFTDSFGTRYNSYSMDLSRPFGELFQLLMNASYTQSFYGSASGGNVWSYGATGLFYLKRSMNFSLTLDREDGQDYSTSRLLARLTVSF